MTADFAITIERTIALTNRAQDYDVACKIRAYILALESMAKKNPKKKEPSKLPPKIKYEERKSLRRWIE